MLTYFPSDYRAARRAFIAACETSGIDVISRVHPSARGRDGKPLFLDTAILGPRDAKKALLLISATHGVEGYFGSAVQTGLMREGLPARVPPDSKIVLLHALNPYGFSWDRRVNEDNADINRNFVDFADPPANEAYDLLAEFISPRNIAPDALEFANAKLVAFLKQNGAMALQEAISRGQYSHAQGVYFGGLHQTWSAAMLKDIVVENLQHLDELIVIDFHTGLGAYAAAEVITEDLPGSAGYERASAVWGASVTSSEAGQSVSVPLVGTIDKAFGGWFSGAKLTFAALEVGTRDMRTVFGALRQDNWLHCYAGDAERRANEKRIAAQLRDAFFPDEAGWKNQVWCHAAEVVESALRSLSPMGYRPPARTRSSAG